MPYSARENDADVIAFVKENNIKSVLDVGAGSGTYGHLLRPYVRVIEGVEIWQPYIDNFNLIDIYEHLYEIDAREVENFDYDLVIYGDIMEHMSRKESLDLWSKTAEQARYGMISLPIVHYPQGAEFGNPYEVHVQEHVHAEDVRKDYGPFIFDKEYDVTGTFIRKF